MPDSRPPTEQRLVLKKYRNRRYYDATRSLHVTLEDIYNLVQAGHDIEVIDSHTGENITAQVLAQIILEQDPLKLGVFPVALLHRIIRANEPLILEFVERYFNQFFQAYLESQRQFNRYMRQAMGLGLPATPANEWLRMMMWPLGTEVPSNGATTSRPAESPDAAAAEITELRQLVQQLREQISTLEQRPPSG